MSGKYLVPCECGLQLVVAASQAGQSLRCVCGRTVLLPTLLELRKFPRVQEEVVGGPSSGWGIPQRLISIGSLILLGALVWLGVLWFVLWPEKPTVPEPIRWQTPPPAGKEKPMLKTTEELTLLESYLAWQSLPRELEVLSDAPMSQYRKELAAAKNWSIVGGVVALLGVLCMVSGWLVGQQKPRGYPPARKP